jgi:hypothetical protein
MFTRKEGTLNKGSSGQQTNSLPAAAVGGHGGRGSIPNNSLGGGGQVGPLVEKKYWKKQLKMSKKNTYNKKNDEK